MNAPHHREIDHHSIIADGFTAKAVTTAAHRHQKIGFSREFHSIYDIGDPGTADNHGRTSVDSAIPDFADLVVVWTVWQYYITMQPISQAIKLGFARQSSPPCRAHSYLEIFLFPFQISQRRSRHHVGATCGLPPLHPFRVQVRDREVEAVDMPRSVSLEWEHDLDGLAKMMLSHSPGSALCLLCDLAAIDR